MAKVTQAEYADRRGVSRQAIYKLVKQGKLTLVDGKVDADAADVQLRDLNPARSKAARSLDSQPFAAQEQMPLAAAPSAPSTPTPAVPASEYSLNKAERERYAALRERLEYERECKLVIKREPVARALFEAGRTLRDSLYAAMRNIAPQCAATSDVIEVEDLLKLEVDRALKSFARLAEAKLNRITESN